MLFVIKIEAQQISMDEAIKMALSKNPELQKQFSQLRKTEAELNESFRFPNLVFNYSREDLKLNNNKIGEWITSSSLPLNFLWERWSNIDSKEKSLEAQRFLFENYKRNIIYQVKNTYTQYHFYKHLSDQFVGAFDRLDKLVSVSKNRLSVGDISEYELQRILIEVNKLKAELKEIELEGHNSLSLLKLLIGFDSISEIITSPIQAAYNFDETEKELLQKAITNRSDLKAVDLLIESETSFLAHNKLKFIPNINLTAGYKKQFDKFSGSVFQLNFEIPLFKRNQLEIEQTEADLNYLVKHKAGLLRQINSEVHLTYEKFKQYSSLINGQKDLQFQNIFNYAVFSYEQGDISLVEFIDGLNAYKEGMKLNYDLQIKYYKSIYELEFVTATFHITENN
jgi:cobalt-zinc-cadmium efflux system outer membrane protein